MAGIVLTNDELRAVLNDGRTRRDGYLVGLFVNDYTPTQTTTFDDLTEASFPGYARQPSGAWGLASINAANEAESVCPLKTWTATGDDPGQIVYGYFIVDASENLRYAERRADGGFSMENDGDSFTLVVRLTERNRP